MLPATYNHGWSLFAGVFGISFIEHHREGIVARGVAAACCASDAQKINRSMTATSFVQARTKTSGPSSEVLYGDGHNRLSATQRKPHNTVAAHGESGHISHGCELCPPPRRSAWATSPRRMLSTGRTSLCVDNQYRARNQHMFRCAQRLPIVHYGPGS